MYSFGATTLLFELQDGQPSCKNPARPVPKGSLTPTSGGPAYNLDYKP